MQRKKERGEKRVRKGKAGEREGKRERGRRKELKEYIRLKIDVTSRK